MLYLSLFRKIIFVIFLSLSPPFLSFAASVTINSTTKATTPFSSSQYVAWYPRTFTISFETNNGAIFDPTCMKVSGSVGLNSKANVTGWGDTSMAENTLGTYKWDLVFTNTCGTVMSGIVKTKLSRYGGVEAPVLSTEIRNISAACSVEVETEPKIPKLYVRDSVNEINISSFGTGYGNLTFKPNEIQGDKGKLTNGSSYLTYSVTGGNIAWDSALGQWKGSMEEHYLKIDDIPSNAASGAYTGNMTATITCL